MSSFIEDDFDFDDIGEGFSDDGPVLIDEDFLNRPIDVGLEVDEEGEVVQQMEATFEQGLQQRIDIGELDPRNPKDKPLIQIGQEMEYLGLARDYIQDFLMSLRAKQDDTLVALPFLNSRYVANAKVYLDEVEGKVTPKSMEDYIKRKNKEYRESRESQGDSFSYLDKVDFYRYIKIDQKILN
jgi:hypothetical protein